MHGLHLTADLRECRPDQAAMTDVGALRAVCLDAVRASGLQPVGELFHRFAAAEGLLHASDSAASRDSADLPDLPNAANPPNPPNPPDPPDSPASSSSSASPAPLESWEPPRSSRPLRPSRPSRPSHSPDLSNPDSPVGITGVVLLAESHLAVHTWPELNAVTLDVYVCNFGVDNSARAHHLLAALIAAFAPAAVERHALVRGAPTVANRVDAPGPPWTRQTA